MRKMIVVADGLSASRTRDAAAKAIELYRQEPVEIHLLSVQPRVSGDVSMFFGHGELHDLQHDAGMEDTAPARSLFDQATVPYQTVVRVGRSAETIAHYAHEQHCDRIVMGRQGDHESLASRVFGNAAGQVRHILVADGDDCEVLGS